MDSYVSSWNLSTIPDAIFWSEAGRRRGARSHAKPKKLAPCAGCGLLLGVVERRKACPVCGARQPKKNQ